MNLIYIHGLDSDANSTKGMLLEKYCQLHHTDTNVLRPDLNKTPAQVCEQLLSLVKSLNNSEDRKSADKQTELSNTVLIGSSLGGYFSTLISNQIGCPVLLQSNIFFVIASYFSFSVLKIKSLKSFLIILLLVGTDTTFNL